MDDQRADIRAQVTECGRIANNYGFGTPRMFVSATVLQEADSANDPLGPFQAVDEKVGLGVPPEDVETISLLRSPLLERQLTHLYEIRSCLKYCTSEDGIQVLFLNEFLLSTNRNVKEPGGEHCTVCIRSNYIGLHYNNKY